MTSKSLTEDIPSIFNITAWAESAANLTQYAPSVQDLLLAGPRVGMKLGSYLIAVPEAFNSVLRGHFAQVTIAEATGLGGVPAATTGITTGAATRVGVDLLVGDDAEGGIASRIGVEGARSFGNIFSYSTSRWAIACVVMAIGNIPSL